LYELDNGRLVIMPPPGDIHGAVELNIAAQLKLQGELRGLGKARAGEVGIVLWRNPDRVVGADAVFIANASLPIQRSAHGGYLETIPDLVVEVRSPNDTGPAVGQKVADYLRAGVKVVLVADPEAQTVTASRPGQQPQVFTMNDTLTVPDVIPGFQMPMADVFVL
jgi:Uma2 family endonuclease